MELASHVIIAHWEDDLIAQLPMGHYAYLWVGLEGVVWLGLGVDGLVQLGLEPGVVPGVAFPGYMVGQFEPEIGVAFPHYIVGQLEPEIGVVFPDYMVGQFEPEIGVVFPDYMVGQLEHNSFLVPSPFYAGNGL